MGLCAGAWMDGKRPAINMQNTDIGASINMLPTIANNVTENYVLLIIDNAIADRPGISRLTQDGKPRWLKWPRLRAVSGSSNVPPKKPGAC